MQQLQQEASLAGGIPAPSGPPGGEIPPISSRLIGLSDGVPSLPLPAPQLGLTAAGGAPPPPPPPGNNPVPMLDPEPKGPPKMDELSKKFDDMMRAREKAEEKAKILQTELDAAGQTVQQQQQQIGQDMREKEVLGTRLNLAGAQAAHLVDHVKLAERRVDELDGRLNLATAQSTHLAQRAAEERPELTSSKPRQKRVSQLINHLTLSSSISEPNVPVSMKSWMRSPRPMPNLRLWLRTGGGSSTE